MAAMNILYICVFPSSYFCLFHFASDTSNHRVSIVWVVTKNELEMCEEERSVPNLRLLSASCLIVLKITTGWKVSDSRLKPGPQFRCIYIEERAIKKKRIN